MSKKIHQKTLSLCIGIALASTAYAGTSSLLPLVPQVNGHFPVEIQNNIGTGAKLNGVSNVYLLFAGQQTATPNPQCLLSLTKNTDPKLSAYNAWTATCQNITINTQVKDSSYALSYLQPDSKPLLIYIPNVISGRAFVSLNNTMDIPMTRAADGTISIQAPSLSNPSDGNYNLIFDKFEYTYDASNIFWIDTTSVDDFALPIALSYTNPTTSATQSNGYTGQTRDEIIQDITNTLGTGSADWNTLIVTHVGQYKTVLRIDAPNTSPTFNPNYLTASTGFNYLKTLISYYSTASHQFTVDCSEVDSSRYPEWVKLGSGKDPGAYLFTGYIQNNQWVFNNQAANAADKMSIVLDLTQATSNDFFGPGQAPFDTPNGTVRSVLVKYLTAAFSVGFVPLTAVGANGAKPYLNEDYFVNNKPTYYTSNSILKNYGAYPTPSAGPWYDLYAKAIHSTAANPVYAFAYDDVLKQDGTLSIPNATSSASVEPVLITLGSVGDLHVPAPGPNYTNNPHPNDVFPALNVSLDKATQCTAGTCTVVADWQNPSDQDQNVKYFILPTPSPVALSAILPAQPLAPYNATTQKISFAYSGTAPVIQQVTVYACIPMSGSDTSGYACPSDANKYAISQKVQGASSPAPSLVLLPVTPKTNSGFTCNTQKTSCALTATWTNPTGQATQAVYYINPLGIKAPMADTMKGQTLTNGTSGTLTLPFADVNNTQASITIATCANVASSGKYCPSSSNKYDASTTVGSVSLAPTGK